MGIHSERTKENLTRQLSVKATPAEIVLISPSIPLHTDDTAMPKLLCLVCMTEETVPAVGHGPGVPSKDGSQLVSADGDSKHDPISIPYHCGKQMKYFEDENADKYRVCPD